MTSQPTSKIKSYHLIFNPVSGPGAPGPKLAEIQAALEPAVNLTVHLTKPDVDIEANLLTKMEREEKNRLGKLAIVINSLRELQDFKQFETRLKTPDGSWHESATAFTIANAATHRYDFGSGACRNRNR